MSQELETDQDVTTGDTDTYRMSLTVDIDKTGPCQRHVRVVVPRKDRRDGGGLDRCRLGVTDILHCL